MKRYLSSYDFNLPLLDAFADENLSLSRRLLAGVAMSQGLDFAYYSTMQLLQAFQQLEVDRREGNADGRAAAMFKDILEAEGCDYQRRVYYLVSDLELFVALGDLAWLVDLLDARAQMFRVFRELGATVPAIPGVTEAAGDPAQPLPHR